MKGIKRIPHPNQNLFVPQALVGGGGRRRRGRRRGGGLGGGGGVD